MSASNSWLRLWHDMPNDPKWRTIARASKQPIALVMAVYVHVLVSASTNATERGRTQSLCVEDVASALDVEDTQVQSILDAMQNRVLDGDHVTGWEKRQPIREDGAAERSKAWREGKKAEKERIEQQGERNRTQPNAGKRSDADADAEVNTTSNEVVGKNAVTVLPVAADDCPHQAIIAAYHELLPVCPHIREWTPARAAALRARWREKPERQSVDWWRQLFAYCARSEFLTGRARPAPGRKPFLLSLDWLVKAENFAKVVEGRYEVDRMEAVA